VDLIMKTGRKCENGKPAPVMNADFQRFAQGLRDAAKKSLAAAATKSQEKVSDSANDLADACANCHEVYRDKGDAKSPLRCSAPAAAKK
jgi:cytochrome c556